MIAGTPKINALAILDITGEIRDKAVTLECKAAYVDTSSGTTRGWVKGTGAIWSPETRDRLYALIESMEQDMAAVYFSGTERLAERPLTELGGIAEHLDEANQA
jgi:hypothetical protein